MYIEYVEKFNDAKILVIGDIMLDRYLWGTVDRISPEAPVPVVKLEKETTFPGGAANVASNIASLTGTPFLVSFRGPSERDKNGIQLINALTEKKVSGKSIIPIEGWKTPVKTRLIAHNQQVVRFDEEYKNEADDDRLIDTIKNILITEKINICVISDYLKNTLNDLSIVQIIKIMNKLSIPIIVDSKRSNWMVFNGITVITPNNEELNKVIHNSSIESLLNTHNIGYILVTRGSKGMSLYSELTSFNIGSSAKNIYDVTGAGDTVVATLALALSSGANISEAAVIANEAAGISVGKFGTSTVSKSELLKILENIEVK